MEGLSNPLKTFVQKASKVSLILEAHLKNWLHVYPNTLVSDLLWTIRIWFRGGQKTGWTGQLPRALRLLPPPLYCSLLCQTGAALGHYPRLCHPLSLCSKRFKKVGGGAVQPTHLQPRQSWLREETEERLHVKEVWKLLPPPPSGGWLLLLPMIVLLLAACVCSLLADHHQLSWEQASR